MDMLYLLLAVIASASMTLVLKWFRAQRGNRYGLLLGNYLTCVLIALLTMPDRSRILGGSHLTLLLGCLGGILFVTALVCMQQSVRQNGATLTAAFSRLGLLVSLLVSILWFGERPGVLQLLGIGLVFCAFFLLSAGKERGADAVHAGPSIALLLLTLLANGGGDAMAKIFEHFGREAESVLYFFWVFSVSAVLTGALLLLEYVHTGKKPLLREFAAGAVVGIPNYYSSYLLLLALQRLPSILVFPIFSTGTILIVLVLSAILFRERLTARQRLGIALILGALVLLNLS